MPQDVQGAVAVWAVEQGKGNHADGREAGADHQCIGQHHRQAFAQGRGQGVAHVDRDHQGDQPWPEFAQRKTQHVQGPGMLRQFFGQAETHPHAVADPDQGGGQQAPDHQDHGKGEQHGQPFIGRQRQRHQFFPGLIEFTGPERERTVDAGKFLLEIGQGSANQAQYALFGNRLGLFGGVAELFQVGQQLGALLVVLQ
ncbi:hypothetical protein D3C71_1358040 [compost metagenome]